MEENVRLGFFAIGPYGSLVPCSYEEAERLMADESGRTIVTTETPSAGTVRTVFLPICLIENDVAQCYETVREDHGASTVLARYSTLSQAVAGHNAAVQQLSA